MVDVTKCIGCRKGIVLFQKRKEEWSHIDLFATREAGATYRCENSDVIGKYLVENNGRGTYLPNEDLKKFYDEQSFWWEDIIDLAHVIFESDEKVQEFFNQGEESYRVHNLPNKEIEDKLLYLAEDKGIKVTNSDDDGYPDLIKFKK